MFTDEEAGRRSREFHFPIVGEKREKLLPLTGIEQVRIGNGARWGGERPLLAGIMFRVKRGGTPFFRAG